MANLRMQFTLVQHDGYWSCYVWEVAEHGTRTRRLIRTVLYAPGQGPLDPGSLLRSLADELDKPYLRRWTPRSGSASPGGS